MSETFTVVNSRLDMIEQLEAVQRASFPTLAEEELITAAHYAVQIERFPEGQLAVLNEEGQAVACSTNFCTRVDFDHFEHRYLEAADHNWLGRHDLQGDWLYFADIGVRPDYRRRGLSSLLYRAHRHLIRRLNLRGHVAGGLLRGYGAIKDKMSAETYVAKVIAGELFDPALSIHLKQGFTVHGLIQHYVDDPSCDGKAAFIVWRNPDYCDRAQALPHEENGRDESG